jgi:hypothetical protein
MFGASQPSVPIPAQDAPPPRDRIVVLGRRTSGKTVFLCRLYEALWQAKGELSMKAADGPTHLRLMRDLEAMQGKRWPAATAGVSHYAMDILFRGRAILMVTPDYSGEIFRDAFMEGKDSPDVRDFLSNLDRAAALIVLVDPGIASSGGPVDRADQEFGLAKAVERVRNWPGGEHVPVAITLTKCDRHQDALRESGGIDGFVRRHFRNLLSASRVEDRPVLVCAAAAVASVRDGLGQEVPNVAVPPRGIVEPVRYCLEGIAEPPVPPPPPPERPRGHAHVAAIVGVSIAVALGLILALLWAASVWWPRSPAVP